MRVISILSSLLITLPVCAEEIPLGFIGLDKKTLASLNQETLMRLVKQTKQDRELSEGKCKTTGQVNRQLLQQTWFFDEEKTDFGMIFDYYSFSDYSKPEQTNVSFCIDGKSLIATQYYFVPDFSVNSDKIVSKLHAFPSVEMNVETLTENKIVFRFPASKETLTLYR